MRETSAFFLSLSSPASAAAFSVACSSWLLLSVARQDVRRRKEEEGAHQQCAASS